MTTYLVLLIIIYVGAIPGIIYGGMLERKGLPQKAIATFSGPDGTRRQAQMDVTWSWTVFLFRGWALAFRGQFLPFIIMMLAGILALGGGIFAIVAAGLSGQPGPAGYIGDYFTNHDATIITIQIIMLVVYLGVVNYYVAFANRERIKQYANRGFDFSQTPNLAKLYEFVGIIQRTKPEDLAPNVKAGQTHDYVVPDAQAKKEEEDLDDYSMLTMNDLKLLLKSEGIPFSTTNSKEELLKLVEKHITKKKKS